MKVAMPALVPTPSLSALSAASKAHLLFSPNVAQRTVACFVAEALLVGAVAHTPALRLAADNVYAALEMRLLKGAHSMAWWSVVAMLASSCCALQLILSALSVGCSGLNSLLGPVRPPMLATTALLQAAAWHLVITKKPEQATAVAAGSALTLTLTLLPELLHLWETRRKLRRAAPARDAPRLELRLASMGCAACEAKVRAVAEGVAGVLRCDVDLDAGTATAAVAPAADAAAVRAELSAALAKAGYEEKGAGAAAQGGGPSAAAADGGACARAPRAGPPATMKLRGGAAWWSDEGLGAVVGGLLGSSCCAVQLGLNLLASAGVGLFGVGCAGFNTWLGPLRPYTRALTAVFFSWRWLACAPARRGALLGWTAVAAGLTLLPELLLHAGAPAIAPPSQGAVRLALKVDGMGCEACQLAVAGALQRASGVVDASADFAAGTAELVVQPAWGFTLGALAAAVEEAGFEVDVKSAVFDGPGGGGGGGGDGEGGGPAAGNLSR